MSRASVRFDPKKVVSTAALTSNCDSLICISLSLQNSELVTLTYGALIAQMVKDLDNTDDVNKQLERLGYNMGIRIIEDYLAKTSTGRCLDLKDTADKIQGAFKMYLGIQPNVANWSAAGDEFSFIMETNPLTDLVELPEDLKTLRYCNAICGAIRGALEMVQLDVQSWIVQVSANISIRFQISTNFIFRIN